MVTIKSAKTALQELKSKDPLRRAAARGVLAVFVDQQARKEAVEIETYTDSQGRTGYKATVGNATYFRSSAEAVREAINGHEPENEKATGSLVAALKEQKLNRSRLRSFFSLPAEVRDEVRRKFVLPEDFRQVVVNEHLVAFERIGGAWAGCTVRNNNFHVHGNKQNQ